ncbi:hypothetical protein SNE26_21995 [Mucilaginibacter sp. cycad4]|uniref:hypothetical protein n=1 Tax=Mucilaginibacter sp. cycad4 TaxID=3342096 RepID=UPI002AABF65B|nr:hypothetical protein [Mucilaginibacter gossypii]WPU98692.1 hypothetical protein SNE26_21995 [Mucilaginibacter gossypii]
MKKFYCLVLIVLVAFAACKKGQLSSGDGEDNGCINRVKRDYSDSNKVELITATKLLQKNNIPVNDLVIYRVILNDSITSNGPLNIYQHVVAYEESNGLPIFNSGISYHFRNEVFSSSIGRRFGTLNLNTKAEATLPQIRKVFIDAFKKDGYNIANNVNESSCLNAEFGYFNLNQDTPEHPNFIKAWKVTFSKYNDYPVAYIQDSDRKLIYYFNGLMTLDKTTKQKIN